MASAAPIGKVLGEATCSICLGYLTEPMTIECGHNFCRACITQYCEQREPESGLKIPCPHCRVPFHKGVFQPKRQLVNIAESIKQFVLQPGQAQKENLCDTHQEKLQFFCQKDGEAICVVCRKSRGAHRAHAVLPIEEAAQDYKEKLQTALGPLRKELEEALRLISEEKEKSMEWQDHVDNLRLSITCEFKKLHQLLSEEEQLLLRRLTEEERETVKSLQDNITKLSEQSSALQQLITEMEEKCQQPAAELLQDVKSVLIRSEHVTLQPPETIFPELKNMYEICLDMREMLVRFTGSAHARASVALLGLLLPFAPGISVSGANAPVDVTLDPDTAFPNLILSEDRKHVRLGDTCQELPDNPERFDTELNVLGAQGFMGGRHYWEVEVGDKIEWEVGVCRESVGRKGCGTPSPAEGYWVWLRGGEYMASTSLCIPLPVSVRPSRVGIFLDYEAGEVSFYSVTDRSHLFTFTDTFSGTLHPSFNPGYNDGGTNTAPLIICPVPAQARGHLCP